MDTKTEKRLFEICSYCHDGDFAVFEEKACNCVLFKQGESYFIRRTFSEKWDHKEVRCVTEDIPVKDEDLDLGIKKLSAIYCNGKEDNEWINTYNIHRDADQPADTTVREMIEKLKD